MTTIEQPYLLVQGSTPIYEDPQGVRWLDRLWAIDAKEHLSGIRDLRIASPLINMASATRDMVRIDGDERLRAIHFVPLPHATSRWRAVLQLPAMIKRLWAAVGNADIIHMGIAGWPYPLGWLAMPMATLRAKRTVVVVESAPWRLAAGQPHNFKARLQAWTYEIAAGAVVRAADARFFTTQSYLDSLCRGDVRRAAVNEATWVPEEQIISHAEFDEDAEVRRRKVNQPLRLAFMGRLTPEKGIQFVLDAIRANEGLRDKVRIDVYGDGPLRAELKRRTDNEPELVGVKLRGTLVYGADFFSRLRDYDYVLVPSISDEQPRIVYDAFSQGVPVIASDTPGLRQCVAHGETGYVFTCGDPAAFSATIDMLAQTSAGALRERLAKNAVSRARSMTHAAMHRTRAALIVDYLQGTRP